MNKKPRLPENYPAAKDLPEKACIRCHQVHELRRRSLQAEGKWSLANLWVYPQPENIGVSLALDEGDRVERVKAGSAAEKMGLKVEP